MNFSLEGCMEGGHVGRRSGKQAGQQSAAQHTVFRNARVSSARNKTQGRRTWYKINTIFCGNTYVLLLVLTFRSCPRLVVSFFPLEKILEGVVFFGRSQLTPCDFGFPSGGS